MAPRLENLDELRARTSKVKLALIDVERGLEKISDTGEYDPRVTSLSSTLQDIPTSTGAFPPTERQTSDWDGEQILSKLTELSERTESLANQDNFNDQEIEDLIELSEDIYDKIDNVDESSTAML